MAGLKEQLENLVVEDGRVSDAKDDEKHKRKVADRKKLEESKKERGMILRGIRDAKIELKVLMVKRDELRKAGNACRLDNPEECTNLYTAAADMGPEIQGLQKHLRSLQQKLGAK